MQIIIAVESNSASKSDYLYIRSAIIKNYNIIGKDIRLTPVYLNGKGNVLNKDGKIKEFIKKYHGNSNVIICIDQGNTDTDINEVNLNQRIREYCDNNGYHLVLFYRDIEEVFLGRRVEDSEKTKCAERFFARDRIDYIDLKILNCNLIQSIGTSNLICVLDLLLGDYKINK